MQAVADAVGSRDLWLTPTTHHWQKTEYHHILLA